MTIFIQQMNNLGVIGAPADLINNAHLACTALDNGNSPDTIADAFISQLGVKPTERRSSWLNQLDTTVRITAICGSRRATDDSVQYAQRGL
jgi:hypothetical protein